MGKIIVVDDAGNTKEYERGMVFGMCHESLDPFAPFHEMEIDIVRANICSIELLEVEKSMKKYISREAKRKLSDVMQNGNFADFLQYMMSDLNKGTN